MKVRHTGFIFKKSTGVKITIPYLLSTECSLFFQELDTYWNYYELSTYSIKDETFTEFHEFSNQLMDISKYHIEVPSSYISQIPFFQKTYTYTIDYTEQMYRIYFSFYQTNI